MNVFKPSLKLVMGILFLVWIPLVTMVAQRFNTDSLRHQINSPISDSAKINTLYYLAWSYNRLNLDSALYYTHQAVELATEKNLLGDFSILDYSLGVFYKNKRDFGKSLHYLNRYIDKMEAEQNWDRMATAYNAIGLLYYDFDNLEASMQYTEKARQHHEKLKDSLGLAYAFDRVGCILHDMHRPKEAIPYHEKGLAIFINLGLEENLSVLYNNLANCYHKLGQLDRALEYYEKALNLDVQFEDLWGLSIGHRNIGNIYTDLEYREKAVTHFTKAIQYAEKVEDKVNLYDSEAYLGYNLAKLGKTQEGLTLLESAIKNSESQKLERVARDAHKLLSEIYADNGLFQKAYQTKSRQLVLTDSLLNASVTDQITNLEVKYQMEKKEQDIALLKAKNEVTDLKLASSRQFNTLLIIALLIFLGLMLALFQLYRKTQFQNQIIQKSLVEKETLLKEIHHRVKNNLQVISSLLKLQSQHIEDPNALVALKESQNRVQSMGLIHENLYQKDNYAGIEIKSYFENLARNLFQSHNINGDRVQFEMEVDPLTLDVETVIPLGLVVNELMTNSLKHAFPHNRTGKIQLRLKEQQTKLNLSIADNGIGVPPGIDYNTKKSFGFRLIHTLKDQLEADLQINGDQGTTVMMDIHAYRKVG